MLILGLNAFHADASACLVRDGRVVAAVEEERFRRVKHWAGFPAMAIRWCLEDAGVKLADLDAIAINSDDRASRWRKLGYVLTHRPGLDLLRARLGNRSKRRGVAELLEEAVPGSGFRGAIHRIEHHRAHLSSAFHASPFQDAVSVSVDGFGDFASAAWGTGSGTAIRIGGKVHFPHSLGILYQALTQHLGFPHYGDEYKVMGLAPYGEPSLLPKLRDLIRLEEDGSFRLNLRYFRHHAHDVAFRADEGTPVGKPHYSDALIDLLGPARDPAVPLTQRDRDLARSVQALYEEAFFHLLDQLQARHGGTDLALAGGCANNSVANGKVRRRTPFRRVYVHAAAGDAGGAIGAALCVWHDGGGARSPALDHAYLGPCYGDTEIARVIDRHRDKIAAEGCTVERIDDEAVLTGRAAAAVAEGKVVGWFQGRAEWGPRALGNRSILGDPRRADMKDILNLKIKRRESFRPFAPSVLARAVPGWFEEDDNVPFMMQVFQIREDKRPLIPAVTHVDGSGRLQTVHAETNPRYHALIEAFERITGVPMVLNTSFNENEPIVCKPVEALDCFLRTKMDMLVLGDTVIERAS